MARSRLTLELSAASWKRRFVLHSCMAIHLTALVLSAQLAYDPVRHYQTDFDTGILWRVTGDGTPLRYVVLPQILTVTTPLVGTVRPLAGGDFVVRGRFSLLAEPFARGPEHHYLGASAGELLEWWDAARTRSLFFSGGGGVGWVDSKGHEIPGALGEDFNFNWFAYPGARVILRGGMSATFGVYFQHISNSGFNKINPGLNAVGPMAGIGWHF
jgi:hypothetical protein